MFNDTMSNAYEINAMGHSCRHGQYISASPLLHPDTLPKRIETYYPAVKVIPFPNIGILDDTYLRGIFKQTNRAIGGQKVCNFRASTDICKKDKKDLTDLDSIFSIFHQTGNASASWKRTVWHSMIQSLA